ncbi:MAG: diguanylate cyclase [Pseudomonadota bacterium]
MEREQSPFAEARVLAGRALTLAEQHRVPPFPRAYEVWFAYASGGHPELARAIDKALADTGSVPQGLIDRLHAEHLSANAMNQGVERIGERAGSDLAEVVSLIEDGVHTGERMSAALERAERDIAGSGGEGDRRRVLTALREEQRSYARSLGDLGQRLDAVRSQFVDMQRELRELRQSVLLDRVTQLPNQKFFEDMLARMLSSGSPPDASLLLLRLEDFRRFSARYGEGMAEAVLQRTAELLRRAVREGDTAARLDGDSFALLLRGVPEEEAAELGVRIRTAVGGLRLVARTSGETVESLTCTSGATALTRGDTPARAMDRAEIASVYPGHAA